MKRRRSANDRAFLNGFLLGLALGQREATEELRATRLELETRFEDTIDNVRIEAAKLLAQFRKEWGLPPEPDPDRRPDTLQ